MRSTWWGRLLLLGLLAAVLMGGWVGGLALDTRLRYQRQGRQPFHTSYLRMAAREVINSLLKPYFDRRLLEITSVPVYDLEMRPGRLRELQGILQRAFERGRGSDAENRYIEAVFRVDGERYDVDIRPRGTVDDHYRRRKPSLRVKFSKDRLFRGVRVTNLVVPYDKLWGDELNDIAKGYGLITYPRKHAIVRLNGQVLGAYQELEHFREELAVRQGRSEGFFFSGMGEEKGGEAGLADPAASRALAALVACRLGCDPAAARELLDRYLDVEKIAVYLALTTLFASEHAWGDDNLILFYDPARGRLEPVPWDVGIAALNDGSGERDVDLETATGVGRALLAVPALRHRRNQILWQILNETIEPMLEDARREHGKFAELMTWDIDHTTRYTSRKFREFETTLRRNAQRLKNALRSSQLGILVTGDGIEIRNFGLAEVEIDRLRLTMQGGDRQEVVVPRPIPGRIALEPGRLVVRAGFVEAPAEVELEALNLVTGGPVQKTELTWSYQPESELLERYEHEQPSAGSESAYLPHSVTVTSRSGRQLWSFGGTVGLHRDLVLPLGATAHFEPGLSLRLGPGVDFVIQGDLESVGSADHPIVVEAMVPGEPFGTLAVLGRSHLRAKATVSHTTIRGGSEGDYYSVHFSGAFSIYDGDLVADRLRIVEPSGEDGLNVKYGTVEISNLEVLRSESDAVDLDFCVGTLRRGLIEDSGGDGMDFSGSSLTVEANVILRSTDKGISVGEGSKVTLDRNTVQDATTGIAVKDRSVATLTDNRLAAVGVGIAVYQKKSVFGSGTVYYRSGSIEGAATDFLLDSKAVLRRETSPPD